MPVLSVGGNVFVPSLMGTMRKFSGGTTGPTVLATRALGAIPFCSGGASDGTNLYQPDPFGQLWGLKCSDLSDATGWTNPVQVASAPITAHLLLADGKLLFGAGDGIFYARNPANGGPVWQRQLPAPIVGSAAWSSATGVKTAVVGCSDGKLYGINTDTSAILWSIFLDNCYDFRYHWPVIVGTTVWYHACPRYLTYTTSPNGINQAPTPLRSAINEVADVNVLSQQDAWLSAYRANPGNYALTLYPIDLGNGQLQTNLVPVAYQGGAISGGSAPPCVDRNGDLIVRVHNAQAPVQNQGGFNTYGFGRLNISTGRIENLLLQAGNSAGWGNGDEDVAAIAVSNGVACFHDQIAGGWISGFFNQDTQTWRQVGQVTPLPGTRMLNFFPEVASVQPTFANGHVYRLLKPNLLVEFG